MPDLGLGLRGQHRQVLRPEAELRVGVRGELLGLLVSLSPRVQNFYFVSAEMSFPS